MAPPSFGVDVTPHGRTATALLGERDRETCPSREAEAWITYPRSPEGGPGNDKLKGGGKDRVSPNCEKVVENG